MIRIKLISLMKIARTLVQLARVGFVASIFFVPAWGRVQSSVTQLGDINHFEFSGLTNWKYQIEKSKSNPNELIIHVPKQRVEDIKRLQAFKSPIVSKIQVFENDLDGQDKILLTFTSSNVEFFDYLTEGPSKLLIDLYFKEDGAPKSGDSKKSLTKKTAIPNEEIDKEEVKKEGTKNRDKASRVGSKSKTSKRNPAMSDKSITVEDPKGSILGSHGKGDVLTGAYDGADPNYERFLVSSHEIKEDSIIRHQESYYIPFPMLETENPYWLQIEKAIPLYSIRPKEDEENKQARLLLTLFEKKRYLVFLKTLTWFRQKFQNSEYNEVIDFMAADVKKLLADESGSSKDFDLALQEYELLIKKYPKNPISEKLYVLLGIWNFKKGQPVQALKYFQSHIDYAPSGSKNDLAYQISELGRIQCLDRIYRWEEAVKLAQDLETRAQSAEIKAEAKLRRADALYRAKKFKEAIPEYLELIKKYPDKISKFPGSIYNLSEALFWEKNYNSALLSYVDFLKKFPEVDHGAFAMTRIGEILDLVGASKEKSDGAYLETQFRYGENPKAIIARIRLTSSKMGQMKVKELESATKSILDLAKKLDWPQIEAFATIMVSDGYLNRSEFMTSAELLIKYYQNHPTDPDLGLFKNRITNTIIHHMADQVKNGDFIGALETHQKYSESWIKANDRLDIQYLLARSFENGGAFQEAESNYRNLINQYYSLKGTLSGKETLIKQNVPSAEVLNLRYAATLFHQGKYNMAFESLKNIEKPEVLNDSEQIERVVLTAKLLENKGDLKSAEKYLTDLIRNWSGQPQLVLEPYYDLSELELKASKKNESIRSLLKVLELANETKDLNQSEILNKAYSKLIAIYLDDKNDKDAKETMKNYLNTFEESKPLASVRYKLGELYFKSGELKKAEEIWADLKGPNSEFWRKLSQEKLKDTEWQSGYNKYIKRIPAMVNSQLEDKTK